MYMSAHPYVGSLVPSAVLACAWIGVWLCHPEMLSNAPVATSPQIMDTRKLAGSTKHEECSSGFSTLADGKEELT